MNTIITNEIIVHNGKTVRAQRVKYPRTNRETMRIWEDPKSPYATAIIVLDRGNTGYEF